jgi:hypothetical protein
MGALPNKSQGTGNPAPRAQSLRNIVSIGIGRNEMNNHGSMPLTNVAENWTIYGVVGEGTHL